VLGLWVENFGWHAAPAIVAPAALLGLASALVLRRIFDPRRAVFDPPQATPRQS
jgi:hypothetical protein